MFFRNEKNAVTYETSGLLTYPHVFSTRLGGVSTLPYLASMNIGENRGDSPENVYKNFNILLSLIGSSRENAVAGAQIHSVNIRFVTNEDRGGFFENTDGFITNLPGIALVVKIADCMPLLMEDPVAGVIAAVHAGWRGSVNNIAGIGVEKMVSFGARPERIRVAAGSSIKKCCYEVGTDFYETVVSLRGKDFASAYISPDGEKYSCDLVSINTDALLAAGVKRENMDFSPFCTCCEPDVYHSHRATRGVRGTMGAAIMINDYNSER